MSRLVLLTVPACVLAVALACDGQGPQQLDDFAYETGLDAPGGGGDDDTEDEGEDTPSDSEDSEPNTSNAPPHADAGSDISGLEIGDDAFLDGSNSSDLDGDTLSYTWSVTIRPPGSQATILNPTSATAVLQNVDKAGNFEVKLTVSDGKAEDSDVIKVSVASPNRPPVADAGIDQRVSLGQLVQLSGAGSYDPDGTPLTYTWAFVSRPAGSVAGLLTADPKTPRFTADVAGSYQVELVVSDGDLSSAADYVTITADPGASTGGGGDGGGGDDCLSCAEPGDLRRAWSLGEAANGLGLGLLPILVVLRQRRRASAS